MDLDRWVDAKRSRDFVTADAIRDNLRAQGIDPHERRPDAGRGGGRGPPPPVPQPVPERGPPPQHLGPAGPYVHPPSGSWHAELDLNRWVEAKRNKDYKAADAYRDNLRSQGIDPQQHRPIGSHPVVPQSGSAETEAMLDDWIEAKRSKDFQTADKIRDELRDRGIKADLYRPKGWSPPPAGAPAPAPGPARGPHRK